jgi:endonuclease YncB( thermonuclease family)
MFSPPVSASRISLPPIGWGVGTPALLLFVFISFSASAEDLSVSVVSVYDGDTFKVNIEGVPDVFGKKISVRIRGIDTPEIRGKCEREKLMAVMARDYARTHLQGKTVVLKNVQRGKYFRLLADMPELSAELIQLGLARPYDGGKRGGWCGDK